jgi:ketosteroid isomerase-like protein
MLYYLLSALVLAVPASGGAPHLPLPQSADSAELVRLESVWNDAHLRGDTVALSNLWAEELVVTVPEMPVMSKADLLRFWRSGRSAITRYETSELRVRVYADAAVVTGRLRRERNFNGRLVPDDWRFTKVYVRRGRRWQVVAYQASVAAP